MYSNVKYTPEEVMELVTTLSESELKELGIHEVKTSTITDNSHEPTIFDMQNACENKLKNLKVEFKEQSYLDKSLTAIKRTLCK